MALVQRPRFYEGQVLEAGDLTAGLEYARSQEARHDRLVHEWGIADGLALVATPHGSYVDVVLQPGLALDGTGREVLVTEAVRLDEKLFVRTNVAVGDPDALYPVMIAGSDAPALPPPVSHSCAVAQASRTVESYKLAFGAPGDELAIARQVAPKLDQGAGGAPDQPRWWILVGFVKWDPAQARFTAAVEGSDAASRRYVGIRADEVTGQGGTLVLRTRTAGTAKAAMLELVDRPKGGIFVLGLDDGHGGCLPRMTGDTEGTLTSAAGKLTLRSGVATSKPTLRLDETADGGTLTFGLQDASNRPSQLMQVDEHGNLAIAGVFRGLHAGAVRIASGIASDGVILPLPDGITDDQVAAGDVVLHAIVTPRAPGPAPYDADLANYPTWMPTSIAASVDAERRVHCLFQWVGFHSAGGAPLVEVLRGACDYLLCAYLKGATP
jgi:hypothetical protein